MRHRQAEPRTAAVGSHREEWIEDLGEVTFWYSWPRVADLYDDFFVIAPKADGQPAAVGIA